MMKGGGVSEVTAAAPGKAGPRWARERAAVW